MKYLFILLWSWITVAAAYAPYEARYVKNHDGDTVTLIIEPWPEMYLIKNVRLAGIDTAELNEKCDTEEKTQAAQAAASRAQMYVEILLSAADDIQFIMLGFDKFGRPLGHILYDSNNLGDMLLDRSLAKPYSGLGKRPNWCGEGDSNT